MNTEDKVFYEDTLKQNAILPLIKELGIELPSIPIQSEELFFNFNRAFLITRADYSSHLRP